MSTDQPAPSPEPNRSGSDNTFFDWMRGLRVPRQPGWIGGVCAGIAARLGIDPIIVRGIVVVVAVLGGPALLLYAAAWLLLPDSYDRIHLQEAIRGNFDKAHAGIGVMALLSFLPIARGITWGGPWYAPVDTQWWSGAPFFWNLFWTAAVIGSVVWLVVWLVQRSKSSPPPAAANASADNSASPADTSAADASGTSTTVPALPPAPEAPPRPDSGATDNDLAAWKEQQAAWKREYDGWKQQQAAGEREFAQQRAAPQRHRGAAQNPLQPGVLTGCNRTGYHRRCRHGAHHRRHG
jgi:phage shock protein PspC (stress-responsive transcriptional regulator)